MNRPVIHTHLGAEVDLVFPDPNTIFIEDIAHSLSNISRFNGHTREPYSVAQHSVVVSLLVSPNYALVGLLHDASEAYLGDVSSPLKSISEEYRVLENTFTETILSKFGLPPSIPQEVHDIDHRLVADEALALFNHVPAWVWEVCPMSYPVLPVSNKEAFQMFMDRFNSLV